MAQKGFKSITPRVLKFIEYMSSSFDTQKAAHYALGETKPDGTPYPAAAYHTFIYRCLRTPGVGEMIKAKSEAIFENIGLSQKGFMEKLVLEELPRSTGQARIRLLELIAKCGEFTAETTKIQMQMMEAIKINYINPADESQPSH